MIVYVLELNEPYEGSRVYDIYSSEESALSEGLRLTMEQDDLEYPPEYVINDRSIMIKGRYDYYTITPREVKE